MPLINDFMSLIYPRYCEACGDSLFKHEMFVCTYCKLNLRRSNYHKNNNNELVLNFAGRVALTHAFCYYLFEKDGKVQKLLHSIKYQNQKELALFIGELYATELFEDEHWQKIDWVVPIPLHKNKLKLRGYNQSEWFAKGLVSKNNKPLEIDSLIRIKETTTQTRKKKYNRWENVEGVFKLSNPNFFVNKHVLLVDDVITTGATMEAACEAFKGIEGIKLSVACIAFASQKL